MEGSRGWSCSCRGQPWRLRTTSSVGDGRQPWELRMVSDMSCGSGGWYGSHGRRPWEVNENTKLLRAAAWLLNFEGQHLQKKKKKKKAKGRNSAISFIHIPSKCHYTDIYNYEGDKARQALT